MSDKNDAAVALAELMYLTACRCDDAWTARGLHETHCASEYREDVETVAAALDAQ